MRFPARPIARASGVLQDLRDGWHEFVSRRWLWVIVLQFAFIVAVSGGTASVLGPLVAHSRLGGAHSWGFILAAYGTGAAVGGLAMLRYRPKRMLLAGVASMPAFSLLLFALAIPLAVTVDMTAAFLAAAASKCSQWAGQPRSSRR
jgi:Transmembrane secretion effector